MQIQVSQRAARFHTAFLPSVCGVLAIVVVLLAVENRRLKEVIAAATVSGAEAPARPRLQVGDVFGSFTLRRRDDAIEHVLFDGEVRRTLVMVYAEQCPACPIVMPAWERIVPFVEPVGRAVAIRLDPPAEGESPVGGERLPVFFVNDVTELPFAKLTTVPLTVLTDEWGTVLWVRYGDLGVEGVEELLGYLD